MQLTRGFATIANLFDFVIAMHPIALRSLLLPVAVVFLSACSPSTPPDEATTTRVKAFKTMLNTFEPLGLMVRDKQPFDPAEAKALATRLQQEARLPFEHFGTPPNGPSKSKPEIWQRPADFDNERDLFYRRVDVLAQAAARPDASPATLKPDFGRVAESCKSCHDRFRLETAR